MRYVIEGDQLVGSPSKVSEPSPELMGSWTWQSWQLPKVGGSAATPSMPHEAELDRAAGAVSWRARKTRSERMLAVERIETRVMAVISAS
jgi:hypothetical protein